MIAIVTSPLTAGFVVTSPVARMKRSVIRAIHHITRHNSPDSTTLHPGYELYFSEVRLAVVDERLKRVIRPG